jgi:phage repressor protein C with HTH and peptisase S24 domain
VSGGVVPLKEGVVPVVGMAKLGMNGYFEAIDYPAGHGDGHVLISSSDPDAYALKVVGDSMEPRIRSGEYVLIEPGKCYMAGDEVLVQFQDGIAIQTMIKVFMYERDGACRFISVNDSHQPITIDMKSILKIHPVGAIIKASRYIAG